MKAKRISRIIASLAAAVTIITTGSVSTAKANPPAEIPDTILPEYTTAGRIIKAEKGVTTTGEKLMRSMVLDNNVYLSIHSYKDNTALGEYEEGDYIRLKYTYYTPKGYVYEVKSHEKLDPEKDTYTATVTLVDEKGEAADFSGKLSGCVNHSGADQPISEIKPPVHLDDLIIYQFSDAGTGPIQIKGLLKGETYTLSLMPESKGQENIAERIELKEGEDGSCNITGKVHLVPYYRTGDINNDGSATIADLIIMNNYLLNAEGEYTMNRFWDVTEDNVINAYDLCALRELLTQAPAE